MSERGHLGCQTKRTICLGHEADRSDPHYPSTSLAIVVRNVP